jgi:hypothetical protein
MKYLRDTKYVYKNNDPKASKEETLSLLDKVTEQKELLEDIKNEFPLNENLTIGGTKDAIITFNSIDNKKYDFDLGLKNLKNLTFTEQSTGDEGGKYKIKFSVVSDDKELISNVETIYDAKKRLLDSLLNMDKFADFMLKNDKQKELIEEITILKKDKNINSRDFNFRFISTKDQDGSHEFLRTIVTKNRYKTYDNPIVFYIALILIHNLSKHVNKQFNLENMYVSDSALNISFLETSGTEIAEGVIVTTGLRVSNSELGDGAAKFETIYRVENKEGKKVTAVKNELTTINHGNKPDTIKSELGKLENLEQNREDTIEAVKKIKWLKHVTRDDILKLMTSISYIRNVPVTLKDAMKKNIKQIDLTKNAFNLLEIFDKLDGFLDGEDSEINLILEARFNEWLTKI